MDWFSWLSKSNLEASLVYDYGITFARNQLQMEDVAFFNHEFLQSMGISIAKHRLEILKLAHKKNQPSKNKKISWVIKNCVRKCVTKLVFREQEEEKAKKQEEATNWHYQEKWREAMMVNNGNNNSNNSKPMIMNRTRPMALSGPLDGKIVTNKMMRLSGPLDYANRSPMVSRPQMVKSPRLSGPLDVRADNNNNNNISPYNVNKTKDGFDYDDDDDDDHALWPTLFRDLKPT